MRPCTAIIIVKQSSEYVKNIIIKDYYYIENFITSEYKAHIGQIKISTLYITDSE